MRFLCVTGARPNFAKIKPVYDELAARSADVQFVHTGQHYDEQMSAVFIRELGLPQPDYLLEIGSGSQAEQTAAVLRGLEPVIRQSNPHVVIVVGDVNSTLGAALVASKLGCRVAHVEAGLRSRDWNMPEEINRVVVDRLSDYLFTPSSDATENLVHEGYREDQIHTVGNVMVDTLLSHLKMARKRSIVENLDLRNNGYVLVTLHRPSNVDDSSRLESLVTAIERAAHPLPVVFPMHPRTKRNFQQNEHPRLRELPPLGYLDFISLELHAAAVVTDSGGVQEETTVLGIPCVTARNTTERPITVSEGTNVVAGAEPNQVASTLESVLLAPPAPRRPALWDGLAGKRIVQVLLDGPEPKRPTSL